MSDKLLPEDVKRFLLSNVDSIAEWEGLLLLRGERQKEWGVAEAAERLYINEQTASNLLLKLYAKGFVTRGDSRQSVTYKYHAASKELEEMIQKTADLYKQFLVPITNLIHSKTKTRIQEFADAFRIKKDKE